MWSIRLAVAKHPGPTGHSLYVSIHAARAGSDSLRLNYRKKWPRDKERANFILRYADHHGEIISKVRIRLKWGLLHAPANLLGIS